MSLTGSQFKLLQQALLSAFPTPDSLREMVRFGLDQNLDAIASGTLSAQVFQLITWAESRGKTAQLLKAARSGNPGNPELSAFPLPESSDASTAPNSVGVHIGGNVSGSTIVTGNNNTVHDSPRSNPEHQRPASQANRESIIDFAILTALEVERRAVCAALGLTDAHRVRHDSRVYWRGRLPLQSGDFYELVVAQCSDMANVDAALLTSDTLHHWRPGAALMVGIAAAAVEEIRLGDVIVGSDIYYYERGKVKSKGTIPEPKTYPADATLWNNLLALPDWKEPVLAARPDGTQERPQFQRGIIASGEKVIADAAARDRIVGGRRKILAIEMEGYGFSAAVWQSFQQVRHLVIRGICDKADSSKNDAWHSYAAATAASFTTHFLRDQPLMPRNI